VALAMKIDAVYQHLGGTCSFPPSILKMEAAGSSKVFIDICETILHHNQKTTLRLNNE
jgi:hypothetical protein